MYLTFILQIFDKTIQELLINQQLISAFKSALKKTKT